jgi:hypothetical protein
LRKYINHISKIHKFGGKGSMLDTSRRAALEREAKITDIQHQRCYHHAEQIKLIFAPTESKGKK